MASLKNKLINNNLRLGKILLIISYTLEGPVVFILLIATNILAINSYRKFNQRKELIDQTNNIEMLAEGELRKKSKIEKTDRKLLMMTSYLSLISILTNLLQFTAQFFYFIMTTLNPKTVGWLIFASIFSQAFKQFYSIIIYYNYKLFRKELKIVANKIICRF
jgi:hypothetical protein